jgi:hypothetical protein
MRLQHGLRVVAVHVGLCVWEGFVRYRLVSAAELSTELAGVLSDAVKAGRGHGLSVGQAHLAIKCWGGNGRGMEAGEHHRSVGSGFFGNESLPREG